MVKQAHALSLRRPLSALFSPSPVSVLCVVERPLHWSFVNKQSFRGLIFPIYITTYHGIRSVDPQLIEMGKSYGLSRWQLYKEIILPGAMPSILVGFRFSLGLVWVLLIVAETISAQSGIGYMTMNAREFLQTDIVLVGILLYALLGKLADVFAQILERYLLRWHAGYQK